MYTPLLEIGSMVEGIAVEIDSAFLVSVGALVCDCCGDAGVIGYATPYPDAGRATYCMLVVDSAALTVLLLSCCCVPSLVDNRTVDELNIGTVSDVF